MDFAQFTIFITVCGIAYAGISKLLQEKLVDRKLVDGIQKESKDLSAEFNKAKAANNKKRMDEIMQKQIEFLPKMNTVMFAQLKPLAITLVFLFLFQYVFDFVDPFKKDDITFALSSGNETCINEHISDGFLVGCYPLQNENYGEWKFTGHAFVNKNDVAQNSSYFYYVVNTSEGDRDPPKNNLAIFPDKQLYNKGETAKIYAKSDAADADILVTLNNGTSFKIELPFTIPLINVKNIYTPYWWFILVSLITNILISIILGQIRKKNKATV